VAIAGLMVAVRCRHLLPLGGMTSLDFDELSAADQLRDLVWHLLVPVCVLLLGGLPIVVRHVRDSVQEIWEAPYIQAARGFGIAGPRLLFCHVLPVAANPAISLFGFSLAGLLGGSLVVEVLTGWPGLGPLLVEATLARDLYVVIGAVMLSVVFLVAGNLTADILLVISDPRIRVGAKHAE
ncbi:MAG: ABC transporter permease, partial [Acidobacteria bacterium]|nr:ABC transporter permease [Acidobacteriota bacterium]